MSRASFSTTPPAIFFFAVPAQALAADIATDCARDPPNAIVLVSVSLVNGKDPARGTVSLVCVRLASPVKAPPPQTNLAVRDYADLGTIKNIYWASPGRDIAPIPLPFTRGVDERGPHISFTLPRLGYWDMVFMQTAASAATRKATP